MLDAGHAFTSNYQCGFYYNGTAIYMATNIDSNYTPYAGTGGITWLTAAPIVIGNWYLAAWAPSLITTQLLKRIR